MKKTLLSALMFCLCSAAFAASVITTRPDDPKAIYLDAAAANADSSAALQAAIDKAASVCPVACIVIKRESYRIPNGSRRFDSAPIGSDIEARRKGRPA